MGYKLIAMVAIRGMIMELEEICEEPIPPDLGESASNSALKRQYYKIRNMIKEMEDLEYNIKKEIGRADKVIRRLYLTKELELELQKSLVTFLIDFNVGMKLRDFGAKRREWLKQKEALEIRLEIDPNISIKPNDNRPCKEKLNYFEGRVDSRQLSSIKLENVYYSDYEPEENANFDIDLDSGEEFAWEELANQLENIPLVGSRDSLEKRIDKIKTKFEFRNEFYEDESVDNLSFGLENDHENSQDELETFEKVKEKDKEINPNILEYLEKFEEIYNKNDDIPIKGLRQNLSKSVNDFILKNFVGFLGAKFDTAKNKLFRFLSFKENDKISNNEIRSHAVVNLDSNGIKEIRKINQEMETHHLERNDNFHGFCPIFQVHPNLERSVKLEKFKNELQNFEASKINLEIWKNIKLGSLKGIELNCCIKLFGNKRRLSFMKYLNWTLNGLLINLDFGHIEELVCFRTLPYLCRKLWHWKRKRVKKKFTKKLDLEFIFFKRNVADRRLNSYGIFFKGSVADRRLLVFFFFKGSVADQRLLILEYIFLKIGSVADRQLYTRLRKIARRCKLMEWKQKWCRAKQAKLRWAERMEMNKSLDWLIRRKSAK